VFSLDAGNSTTETDFVDVALLESIGSGTAGGEALSP
jgi:hypothetical protein